MRSYRHLLRRRSTSVSLLASFLGAVPVGMWPLAIVLGALAHGGSAADAGVLAAVFGAGNAIGIVTQGALLARGRPTPLLLGFSLVAIPAALLLQAGTGGIAIAGAVLAGVGIPAITPAVRGWFAVSLGGDERPGAYALVNVLFQAGVAGGPVAVAALATAGLVGIAFPVAAVSGIGAVVLVACAGTGRIPAAPAPAAIRGTGSLRGVPVLLAVAASAGVGLGALQVLVPVRTGAGIAGAAFAALALAEVAGAIVVGGRVRAKHAPVLLGAGTIAMALVYLLLGGGVAAVAATIALGLATAVQSIGSALLLDRFVPPTRIPAVFATQVAVLILGTSVGALLAGALPETAFLVVAGLLAASAAAGALLLRRRPAGGIRSAALPTTAR